MRHVVNARRFNLIIYRAYELGYEVVGTDCNADSIKDFFDSKLKRKYLHEKVDKIDGTLYKHGGQKSY